MAETWITIREREREMTCVKCRQADVPVLLCPQSTDKKKQSFFSEEERKRKETTRSWDAIMRNAMREEFILVRFAWVACVGRFRAWMCRAEQVSYRGPMPKGRNHGISVDRHPIRCSTGTS